MQPDCPSACACSLSADTYTSYIDTFGMALGVGAITGKEHLWSERFRWTALGVHQWNMKPNQHLDEAKQRTYLPARVSCTESYSTLPDYYIENIHHPGNS